MIDKLICKTGYTILNKAGRGSDFPGRLAFKLNKNFLKGFEKAKTTIFITGTAGKTTVSCMLASCLEYLGYNVGYSKKGANLLSGVTTTVIANSTVSGKSKVDFLVLEIDERFVKEVVPFIKPDYFIIGNITRDQLARNGHFDIVFDDINNNIDNKTHLILNSYNPLSAKFAVGKKNDITYFGVAKNKYSGLEYGDKIDVPYCPVCGSKLNYEYFNYGNFGSYACPNCDFGSKHPDFQAEYSEDSININGQKINMPNNTVFGTYNIAAVYAQLSLLGIDNDKIVDALNHLDIATKRYEEFTIGKHHGTILLSKNETPISYNQSINYVSRIPGGKTVAIGFTRISGRYDEKDISWFYDVDYEMLANSNIKKLILFGKYAYDLAVRLQVAGMDMSKVQIEQNHDKVYETLKAADDDVYCLFYFDMEKKIKKQLKEAGEKVW